MHHRHEVEALADGERVADLLIAAIAEVELVPKNGHGNLRVRVPVQAPDLIRAIARGIVDHEDFAVVLVEQDRGIRSRTGVRVSSAW